MNYFTHGLCFVDRPIFLVGTAVPDWLAAVDRKVRVRVRQALPFLDGSGSLQAEVAAGVVQHIEDDLWFHRTRSFLETTTDVARMFRRVLGEESGFRHGFLGHIVTELVLDGVLIEQYPVHLERYYSALRSVDGQAIQQAVNQMAQLTTSRLTDLIAHFSEEQVLRDYLDTASLRLRLNQVMGRIKLKPLPEDIEEILTQTWQLVKDRVSLLLPAPRFSTIALKQGIPS